MKDLDFIGLYVNYITHNRYNTIINHYTHR